MPPVSVAREFFDRISTAPDPIAVLRGLIHSDPPTVESDHFDCKQEDRDVRKRDQKTREIWSEVLGGFANVGGGVLIWGLDARKTEVEGRQVDAVCGEVPVANPEALASRLRELQRQATDPPLGGVEIVPYPLPGDRSKGFVVCLVPDGPFKPYRSEHAGKQYYMRAGDNTQVMPRSVLSALFYPKSVAAIRTRATLSSKPAQPKPLDREGLLALAGVEEHERQNLLPQFDLTCEVNFLNSGTATAKDLFVRVQWRLPNERAKPTVYGGSTWQNYKDWFTFYREPPLHPGGWASVFSLEWVLSRRAIDAVLRGEYRPGGAPPDLRLEVYAENQPAQYFQVCIDLERVLVEKQTVVEADPEAQPSQ